MSLSYALTGQQDLFSTQHQPSAPLDPRLVENSFYSLLANIDDRQEQDEVLNDLSKNHPAFKGQKPEEIGGFINWKLGELQKDPESAIARNFTDKKFGAKGAGYDRFNSGTRLIDAMGYNVRESFTNLFGIPGLASFGDMGEAAFGGAAKLFGADEDTQQAFSEAGRALPAGLGTFATALVPGVGPLLMPVVAYGGAVDEAKKRGATPGEAALAGGIDAAVNMLTMKMGTALQTKSTAVMLEKSGVAKALMDTSKQTGREMLENAVKAGTISRGKEAVIYLGAETLTNAAQSAVGIAGEVAREFVIDPEAAKQMLGDPNYWATTIATESGMAAFGTVVGRYNHGKALERAKNSENTPNTNTTEVVDSGVARAMDTTEPTQESTNTPGNQLKSGVIARPLEEQPFYTFETESGSTYSQFERGPNSGFTQRYVPEDRPAKKTVKGFQQSVARTIYLDPSSIDQYVGNRPKGEQRVVLDNETETFSVMVRKKDSDTEWENHPNLTNIPFQQKPQIGFYPLEGHQQDAVGWKSTRPGSKIIKVDTPTPVFKDTVEGTAASDLNAAKSGLDEQKNKSAAAVAKDESLRTATETQPAVKAIVMSSDEATLVLANHLDASNLSTTQTSSVPAAAHIIQQGENATARAAARMTPTKWSDLEVPEGYQVHIRDRRNISITKEGQLQRAFTSNELAKLSNDEILNVTDPALQGVMLKLKSLYEIETANRQTVPVGQVKFDKVTDQGFMDKTVQFLNKSGISDAMVRAGLSLEIRQTDPKSTQFIHQLGGFDTSNVTTVEAGLNHKHAILRFDPTRVAFLHELGHIVDYLIINDGFGSQARGEWMLLRQKLRDGDTELSDTLGVKVVNKLGLPVTLDAIKSYRDDPNKGAREGAAEAFNGYMLNKKSAFKDYVESHFPEVHKILKGIVENFVRVKKHVFDSSKPMTDQVYDKYNPYQAEVKSFFDRLFNPVNETDVNQQVKNKVNNFNLSERVATAYSEIVSQSENPGVHEAISRVIDAWSKDPNRSDDQLIQMMKMLSLFEQSGMTSVDIGRIETEGVSADHLMLMPNIKRVIENSHLAILGVDKVSDLPEAARAIWESLGESADLDSYKGRFLEALDKAMNPPELRKNQTNDISGLANQLGQLIRVDYIVGQWLRGEFPEQNGVPMGDARTYQNLPKIVISDLKGENFESFVKHNMEVIHGQFPLLFKKLRAGGAFGGTKSGFVKVDGSFELSKKGRGVANRLVFTNQTEAKLYAQSRNEMGDAVGMTFVTEKSASGANYQKRMAKERARLEDEIKAGRNVEENSMELGRMDGVWVIKVVTDPFKKMAIEYDSQMMDMIEADYHAASLPNDSIAADNLNRIHSELRAQGFNAQMKDAVKFTGEFLKTIVGRLKQGDAGFVGSMKKTGQYGMFGEALRDVHQALNDKEGFRMQFKALAEDLGVSANPVDVFVKLLDESTKRENGKLRELQSYMGQDWVDFADSMATLAHNVMQTELDFNRQRVMEGKAPHMDFTTFKALSEVEYMKPSQQVEVDNFFEFMQSTQDEGAMQNIQGGRKFLAMAKWPFGKAASLLESLVHNTYGNPIHIADSNPKFSPVKRLLVNEVGNPNLYGTSAIEEIHLEGKIVPTEDGDFRFVKKENGKIDHTAFHHVQTNPELHALADTIMRASQKTRMTLQKALNFEPSDMLGEEFDAQIEAASEIKQSMFKYADGKNPEKVTKDMEMLREYLYRTYATTLSINRSNIKMEREYQSSHTALLLYKGADTNMTTEQADTIARKMSDLAPTPEDPNMESRRKMLKESTGWDDKRVQKFDEGWVKTYNEITKLGMLYENSPWYVSERRFRRWIVNYAVNEGVDKGRTGTRDFDTAEEAQAFMKNHPKEITITSKNPKDQHEGRASYRGYTQQIDEAVSHVVASRKAVMDIMLNDYVESGRMEPSEVARLTSLIGTMESEIMQEAASGKTMNDVTTKRYFKPGREHLDMMFQVKQYVWSTAIERSRRLTDAGFALYGADTNISGDSRWERFKNTKEMIRTPDSKMQRQASKAAFTMFMAGNVSTALIEVMQFPISLSHILVENGSGVFNSFRTPAAVAKRATAAALARLQSGSDDSIWTGMERDIIREAERRGRLNVRNYIDINDDAIQESLEYNTAQADPGWNGKGAANKFLHGSYSAMNKFYGFFNRINAELSLVSAFNVLKDTKYKGMEMSPSNIKALFEESMDIADAANGSHGRVGRPRWMATKDSGMRTVGQLAWSLQSYATSYIANWLRLMNKSINGQERGFSKGQVSQARKGFAVMTATQLAGFGIMGIPLVGAVAKIAQIVFGEDPESEIKDWLDREFTADEHHAFSDTLMYGMQKASGLPMDVRSRFAVQGLGPLNAYEGYNTAEFGGPLLSFVGTAINGLRSVRNGDTTLGQAATNLLPVGFQRAARMMLFDGGNLTTRGGKFVMQMTPMEKGFAVAGFSPSRYTDHVRSQMMQRFANEQDSMENSKAKNELAMDLLNNNPDAARVKLPIYAQKLGMDPKELAQGVSDKVMQKLYPSITSPGSGPNAQRAARMYTSPLPMASNVDRKRTQYDTLSKLGYLPRRWERGMQDAFVMDQMQQVMPYATKSQLRSGMHDFRMNSMNQGFLPSGLSASPHVSFQEDGLFGLFQSQ